MTGTGKLLTPTSQVQVMKWWTATSESALRGRGKEVNGLIILVMHYIWKERNRPMFHKVTKTRSWLWSQIWDEWRLWQLVRRRKNLSRGTVGSRE